MRLIMNNQMLKCESTIILQKSRRIMQRVCC